MDLKDELMEPGHLACAGCGAALAMRIVSRVLPHDTRVVIPAGCWSIITGQYPNLSIKMPNVHTPFALASGFATGMRAAIKRRDKDCPVMVWAGDGATYDIGFGAVSAAAERNEDILYICYDNEAYMNTGAQKSSSTPYGAWTTTTPDYKKDHKKDIIFILSEHEIPYAATASVSHPDDLINKVKKALKKSGFRFILILTPCPTGWIMEEDKTVTVARLAVETGVFPLVEIEDGNCRLTHEPCWLPVERYLELQGRFRNISKSQILNFKNFIEKRWNKIRKRAQNAHL